MSMVRSRADWLLFIALSLMWGSSYLFIKIGVEAGLTPFVLVMLRLLIGFAVLVTVVFIARERLPRGFRAYAHLTILGFFGIALPFSLITWAENSVDSAVAAVLTAPTPIFVIPIAALLLHDERLTINRFLGVVVGLAGVAILVGFDPAKIGRGELTAELALVGACVSYAMAGVYARRFVQGYRPMIPAMFEIGTALVMITVMAFVFEHPLSLQLSPEQLRNALFAVAWLGVFGSGLAFMIFFRLISNWGATRTALVAYVMPIWGIILGAVVLGEVIDAGRLTGSALVIGGIALVNVNRESLAGAANRIRRRSANSAPAVAEATSELR
jgi:drug/metabolite transporter (DMT)-like permease